MITPDSKSIPISLPQEFDQLRFVGNRKPNSSEAELQAAFAQLAAYRDGGIFIGHYAGKSAWERHAKGDEIVFVVDGETTLTLLTKDGEMSHDMGAGDLLVVPRNTWHRFETPREVKILTATPQPTEHSVDHPGTLPG